MRVMRTVPTFLTYLRPLSAAFLMLHALLFLTSPATLALAPSSGAQRPTVGAAVETARYRVTLAAAEQVKKPAWKRLVWSYTFRTQDLASGAVQILNFSRDDEEILWFGVAADRLYVARRVGIGILSLVSDKLEEDVAALDPVVSPRGDMIAYRVFPIRFADSERQGSIVAVLDLAPARHRYVFPEPDKIKEVHNGPMTLVIGPESDLAEQHDVNELFWSPTGGRLAFLCAHGFKTGHGGQMYLVVVDLGGSKGSRFVHQPLAPQLYRKPGGKAPLPAVYFRAASVTWIDANTLEVRPAAEYSDKVRDRFVVKLSEIAK
jgi:hypothetical protein